MRRSRRPSPADSVGGSGPLAGSATGGSPRRSIASARRAWTSAGRSSPTSPARPLRGGSSSTSTGSPPLAATATTCSGRPDSPRNASSGPGIHPPRQATWTSGFPVGWVERSDDPPSPDEGPFAVQNRSTQAASPYFDRTSPSTIAEGTSAGFGRATGQRPGVEEGGDQRRPGQRQVRDEFGMRPAGAVVGLSGGGEPRYRETRGSGKSYSTVAWTRR